MTGGASISTSKSQAAHAERRHSSYHRAAINDNDSDDDAAQVVSVSSQSSSRKTVERAQVKRKRARTASSSGSEEDEQDARQKSRPTKPTHSSSSHRASLLSARPAQAGVRKSTGSRGSREADAKGKSNLQTLDADEEGEEDSESENEDDVRPVSQIASSSRMKGSSSAPASRRSVPHQSSRLAAYDDEASAASASEERNGRIRSGGREHGRKSEAAAAQSRAEGLSRNDSLDSQSSAKTKGKGRERKRERGPAAASDDEYVDKADKARLQRPSPSSGRQTNPTTLIAASSSSSLGARTSGPGTPSQKEKRQQKELQDLEDSFNEAAAASARWEQRAKKAEQELVALTRSQNDSHARASQVDDISDEAVKAARAEVEAKDRELLLRQSEKEQLVIKHREDLKRLTDKHKMLLGAQTQASHSNEKVIHKLRAEHGEEVSRLHEQYEQMLERMQVEMNERSATSRLAAKENEIERLHRYYNARLDELGRRHDRLMEAYEHAAAIWSGNGSDTKPSDPYDAGLESGGASVPELQRKVRKLESRKEEADALILSMRTYYEDTMKKNARALASERKDFEERSRAVEVARTQLENEKERYRLRWMSEAEKNAHLLEELKSSREVRPEWEKLSKECPLLRDQVEELTAEVESLTNENSKMLKERVFYVEALNKTQKELDELRSLGHGSIGGTQHIRGQPHRDSAHTSRSRQKIGRSKSKGKERATERQGDMRWRVEDGDEDELADEDDDVDNTIVGGDYGDTELDLLDDSTPAARPRSPVVPVPQSDPLVVQLQQNADSQHQRQLATLERFESTKPAVSFPPLRRIRKADTKVPRHKNRVYVRSECHTPYVPDEHVEDSDDEFYDWEFQAYARSQARNPDAKAAVVNVCWARWLLDNRGRPARPQMGPFCTQFVEDYGEIISKRRAGDALLSHVLQLVKLGQLVPEEGSAVMRAYHQSLRA